MLGSSPMIRASFALKRRETGSAIVDFVEYWTRYIGAPDTAFHLNDIVVGVAAVRVRPAGMVAAAAGASGKATETATSISSPATRRPTRSLGCPGTRETSFTLFPFPLNARGPECGGSHASRQVQKCLNGTRFSNLRESRAEKLTTQQRPG